MHYLFFDIYLISIVILDIKESFIGFVAVKKRPLQTFGRH